MNQWLLPASSQQGLLPGGSPAEEGGHVYAAWKTLGLCALTGAKPLCPGLSRAGYTGQVQGTLDLDWLLTQRHWGEEPAPPTTHIPPPAPL